MKPFLGVLVLIFFLSSCTTAPSKTGHVRPEWMEFHAGHFDR